MVQIAKMFDCPTSPSAEMVDCLRTVDAQELVRATKNLNCTVSTATLLFEIYFDNRNLIKYLQKY